MNIGVIVFKIFDPQNISEGTELKTEI